MTFAVKDFVGYSQAESDDLRMLMPDINGRRKYDAATGDFKCVSAFSII